MAFQLATRTVTAPDPDGSTTPPIACAGADRLSVGGTATAPGAAIEFKVIYTDADKVTVVGCSTPVKLVTKAALALPAITPKDWAGRYLGVPVSEFDAPPIPACAVYAFVKVDDVTGEWKIGALASFPPGTTPPF
jgi:hypothetical protein